MTTLSKDEIVKMAREAGLWVTGFPTEHIEHFDTLCRAPLVAENEGLKESLESVLSQLKERDAELARVRAVPVPKDWRDAVQEFVTRCESGKCAARRLTQSLLSCYPPHPNPQRRSWIVQPLAYAFAADSMHPLPARSPWWSSLFWQRQQ